MVIGPTKEQNRLTGWQNSFNLNCINLHTTMGLKTDGRDDFPLLFHSKYIFNEEKCL